MEQWVRFNTKANEEGHGVLVGDVIHVYEGDLFGPPQRVTHQIPLNKVQLTMPCCPGKMIGLWNNFHERARVEGLKVPTHPLYFFKAPSCFLASGQPLVRPRGYQGDIVFEGELGIVIGKECYQVPESKAAEYIFGYTCVNDVTARTILKSDPSFVQWSRAKSFNTFGAFGPVIARGASINGARVVTRVNGNVKQDYAVSDMIFSPLQIVSMISHDMTLCPGDIIACGTSVGAGPLAQGDRVEVDITGIGCLSNTLA